MKRLAQKFENIMMALTFAEAGEHDTARELMRKDNRPDKNDRLRPSKKAEKVLRASAPSR